MCTVIIKSLGQVLEFSPLYIPRIAYYTLATIPPLVYDNNQSVSFLFLVTLFLFVENRTLKEVKYTDISKMHNSIDNNFDCVHYFNNNDFS